MKQHSPLRLSKYSRLFHRGDDFLLYSSKRNDFYELNRETYDFLQGLADVDIEALGKDERDFVEDLHSRGILATPEEDADFLDSLEVIQNMRVYGPGELSLTVTPTISCNLRCPYCFEENKPAGMMNRETADRLIEFIKSHQFAKTLGICWFGGEPLLGTDIMEYILDRVAELKDIKLGSHSIITNGTLVNDKAIALFRKYPLDTIQITLDGDKPHHDKKRIYPNGGGTFDLILENIGKLLEGLPKTYISLRVNVDNTNKQDYAKIREMIAERFGKERIHVYPGILTANKGCENETFFTSRDHMEFFRNSPEGAAALYPRHMDKGCGATRSNSYVIGPRGEIYLCWEHVGIKEKEIGSITGKAWTRPRLFNTYMLKGTSYSDEKCRDCFLFPICFGGCPDKRIRNLTEGDTNDLCSIYNVDDQKALEEMLFLYYSHWKETAGNKDSDCSE